MRCIDVVSSRSFRYGCFTFLFLFIISVLAVLLSCVLVEQTSALPDIAGIISGLSQKAMGILKGLSLPVLNSQVGFIRQHIDGLLSFFKDKEGDVSKTIIKAVLQFDVDGKDQ